MIIRNKIIFFSYYCIGDKMKKNIIMGISCFLILILGITIIMKNEKELTSKIYSNNIEATVLSKNKTELTIQDNNNVIYTIQIKNPNVDIGDKVLLEYTGALNKNIELQEVKIVDYGKKDKKLNEDGIDEEWLDNGIFSDYYILANNKLKTMTLDEKISQLLLVRYPNDTNATSIQKNYQFGGYVFFEKDFNNKNEQQVKAMINSVQEVSKIPMLTAVDEEGGTVIRISNNPALVSDPFKSPNELYNEGGFELIQQDTINKSRILYNLGLNLNLAPVVDIAEDENDYIYDRTIGQNTDLTSTYAKTVIEASKNINVSYTLKHFPGYGNNNDTHIGEVIDNRSYENILKNDIPPFEAGIEAGAEAILVNHNIVANIDKNNPASLSPTIHNLLRNELKFTGIIITDEIEMNALSDIENTAVKAILAGNDLIMTTNYEDSINSIKDAIKNGTISEDMINKLTFRVLSWKYYKGLIDDSQK